MTTEAKILFEWKSSTKSMVFNIPYLTKQLEEKTLTYSYIRLTTNEEIIEEMIKISKMENFHKWLLPSKQVTNK